jgi:hypothetical protein
MPSNSLARFHHGRKRGQQSFLEKYFAQSRRSSRPPSGLEKLEVFPCLVQKLRTVNRAAAARRDPTTSILSTREATVTIVNRQAKNNRTKEVRLVLEQQ